MVCLLVTFPERQDETNHKQVKFKDTTTVDFRRTMMHHGSIRHLHSSFALWSNSFRWCGAFRSKSGQPQTGAAIRLSKRMSELDLCSRREADRLILEGRILLDGKVAVVGEKIVRDLSADRIQIVSHSQDELHDGSSHSAIGGDNNIVSGVVLNKPVGYVSGQAEHGHSPAIRLLTRSNFWRGAHVDDKKQSHAGYNALPTSWKGYAPAGRLDMDSTGLVVFTQSGVLAKKLIRDDSRVEKEYIVHLSPAVQPTKRELAIDRFFQLPTPTLDLTRLLNGGELLLEDDRHRKRPRQPLKPCLAQWLTRGEKLRVVLLEGRKHHIRRACREILGWHVTHLQRIRIGPVHLDDLPEGCWRTLRKVEVESIMA